MMPDAITSILPYAIGLVVSPLPVITVILLLVSQGGRAKTLVFEVSWLIASFFATLTFFWLFYKYAATTASTEKPTWQYVMTLVLGSIMLLIALVMHRRIFRARHGKTVRTPGWLRVVDRLSGIQIAGLAAVLVVCNPVNLSMILAASVTLANVSVPGSPVFMPILVFVLVGSISVLLPFLAVMVSGRKWHAAMHGVRRWLIMYGDILSFWTTLAFAIVFLVEAIRGLW